MKILKVDDKWSVVYDEMINDRPLSWSRYGDNHYPYSGSNADLAMFYALKEAREAIKEAFQEGFQAGRDGGWIDGGTGAWNASDAKGVL
jgi:hypothetical protein